MVIIWLDFGEVLLETFILANFLLKIRMCFFKVKHYFGHISGMVGPIDVKRNGSLSVECWVQYVTFDLTHDLDIGCFKVKFRNSSGIVGLIDVKWKWNGLIWYWADCRTLPFDHTLDLDPGVDISRSKSEITLSQEWDGRLTWNEKYASHPFMTMILTSVTMFSLIYHWTNTWANNGDAGHLRRHGAHYDVAVMLSSTHSGSWFMPP